MLLLNIVLLTTSTQILASQFAEPLPRFLDSRADTSGGWALSAPSCPSNVQTCDRFCCPSSMDCVRVAPQSHCCPKGTTCEAVYKASPQCADDSWSLWNRTDLKKGDGYFCCLPGQIGTNSNNCVAGNTPVVATLSAQLLSSAAGGPPSASTSVAKSSKTMATSAGESETGVTSSVSVVSTASQSRTGTPTATPAATSSSSANKISAMHQIGLLGGFLIMARMLL
ncbi:hypothetical protein GLAREA_11774 [Glarea lozoyensis ATCC 20868]|uniref:Uncharacterized protein n=1 Tax=Glarea lozoyensis (strain ATCC 20868 / MF5171) TaxID=1116229 RepID=S3DEW2_GLAL2|nr:uncharacterized protein GLAREA_11774 [Glarea lozoyensis ATCC 20868]EPE25193.1 hypothetical protein GLAREA_11774 [Glarea lozoyensis ATCC 20868]